MSLIRHIYLITTLVVAMIACIKNSNFCSGFYCNATYGPVVNFGIYECPQGFYCLDGTKHATEYPCPPGKYLNRTKGSSPSDCIPCSGRYACDSPGLANPIKLCSAGYFCKYGANTTTPTLGVSVADKCPKGMFCVEGKVLVITK